MELSISVEYLVCEVQCHNNQILLINAVAHVSLFQHVFILTQNIFTKGI